MKVINGYVGGGKQSVNHVRGSRIGAAVKNTALQPHENQSGKARHQKNN